MWCAVQTHSNYEARVHQQFGWHDVPDLYPCFLERTRWSDRQKEIERPIFAGYLFAQIESAAVRTQIVATAGVCRILPGVTEPEIATIRLLMAEPERLGAAVPALYVPQAQDFVEVIYGPLTGRRAVVTRAKKGKTICWISIPSMAAAIPVQIDVHCLRKVSAL